MNKKRITGSQHRIISNVEYSSNCFEIDMTRNDLVYEPGACISIHEKSYSLCSSPKKDEYSMKILVRKFKDSKVSIKLSKLYAGDTITIDEVFNYFKPGQTEKYCYIATGVGISPFISALKTYSHKPLMMLYGAKTKNDLYERAWLKTNFNISFAVSQDAKTSDIHRGRVTELLAELPIVSDITYYLCGIEGMISETSKYLMDKGITFDKIKQELFYSSVKG